MSNRKALRRLSQQIPTPPEIKKIIDSLNKESDISVAILGAAIVEASLEQLIVSKIKYCPPELLNRVFGNRGPMSDFDSKILVAQCFDIITSPMADELHSVRAVRNVFAHAKKPLNFNHQLLSNEIDSLRMLTAMRKAQKAGGRELKSDNKSSYLMIIKLLLIIIDELTKHPGPASKAIYEFSPDD